MNPLVPDPKAGSVIPPPGSEACGCCEGIETSTPEIHANRSGLSAIDYRIGGYAQFRESLLAGLSDSAFQPLQRLRTRDPDDFTIALIDAFACSADVLTFYQERVANESWLRTATERVSLQEMARLIGYRLRPGVAAETWLAFAVEQPRQPPPGAPPEPGAFVTGIPEQVTLDVGLKVQSVPGPGEKPQTFETVEPVDARPEWNLMRPWLTQANLPAWGDQTTWLQGVATGLKPGDALLIVGSEFDGNHSSNRWDFRILSAVSPDPQRDRTRVEWRRGLGSYGPYMDPASTGVRVFALRRRASVFGHNAPMWRTLPADTFRSGYLDSATDPGNWPSFQLSPAGPTTDGGYVDLDAAYPAVAPGSYAVLARGGYDYAAEPAPAGTYVELYAVAAASDISREEFALAGTATRLRLQGDNYDLFRYQVRETRVFVQSEELQLAPRPVTTAVTDDAVPIALPPDGLLPGRRVIVQGTRTDGIALTHPAVLTAVHADGAFARLTIDPPLPAALLRDSVTVAGNVALARHGETVSQILGSGDASRAFQRFELKQTPLTWRAAAGETGAASELTLRVAGIEWKERPTLYGAADGERVFTLQTDETGRDWVRFGDGVRGARLPSGVNNVRAVYRKGIGQAGNVRADSLTQLMTRPLGLKTVANPLAAAGGTDPDSADQARAAMPLTTRTLGRVVSLLDYEDFARAFSGIAKAQAAVLRLGRESVVGITVAGQDGDAVPAPSTVWSHLRDALRDGGDPHVALRLMGYQASTFRLGLRVKCADDRDPKQVLPAVEAALRDAFGFARRALGQAVQQSEVIAIAQGVPGVVGIELDRLYGGTAPYAQTLPSRQVRLLASRMRVSAGAAQPAELLTLDSAPLDRLEVLP
ncbi:putative baseplate assembly protein [Dyella ginsengisoli]|uniref:putative baseplate assembly protein n=1 Tax=Dyella ginsengisoli TaxID=363848 RepID=UPI000347DA5F|nr:putative baseplate assembly protein [Dyella ginsengisoli]